MAEIASSNPEPQMVGDTHTGVHNITEASAFEQAKSQPGVMVLDAYAEWCGPCKMIAPKIVSFSKAYSDVRFYKIDVDELPELSEDLGITAMPTILIFKDGEPFETIIGANPKAIESAIKSAIGQAEPSE